MINPLKKLGELGFTLLEKLLCAGIMEDTMAEDLNKINQQIVWLNGLTTPLGVWVAIPGMFALTSLTGELKTKTNIVFNPANGYVVKIFVNQANGEMRLFPAILFEQDG